MPARGVGYVTRFRPRADFAARYPAQQVGGRTIREFVSSGEELDELNANIVGLIEVVYEFQDNAPPAT